MWHCIFAKTSASVPHPISAVSLKWMRRLHFLTHWEMLVWTQPSNLYPPLIFSLCLSFSSLCLSSSDHLPPVFPSMLINRLLMKAWVQRHANRERGREGRWDREEFWSFVKTCPLVCLFACLLLWCESLNELPARTTTQHLLLGFLPFMFH